MAKRSEIINHQTTPGGTWGETRKTMKILLAFLATLTDESSEQETRDAASAIVNLKTESREEQVVLAAVHGHLVRFADNQKIDKQNA